MPRLSSPSPIRKSTGGSPPSRKVAVYNGRIPGTRAAVPARLLEQMNLQSGSPAETLHPGTAAAHKRFIFEAEILPL